VRSAMGCDLSKQLCLRASHSRPIVFAALTASVGTALVMLGACTCYVYQRIAPARRRRFLGVLLILMVVLLWTASSVAVQLVFESARYRKPFFLTYLSTSLLTVYLPWYPKRMKRLASLCAASVSWTIPAAASNARRTNRRANYDLLAAGKTDSAVSALDLATQQQQAAAAELAVAMRLCVIFFAYQLCYNVGLELSTVSTVTVISTSSGLWTLLFSALRLGERVGPVKFLSTLLTFAGVLLVVAAAEEGGGADGDDMLTGFLAPYRRLADRALAARGGLGGHLGGHASSNARWGNGATLLSALLYGAFAAQLKYDVPTEDVIPVPYLFGLLGLLTFLLFMPCIAILHFLRLEYFSLPSQATLLALVLNGLLGSVLSNMLLARAMLLASPLVATLGLSLTIPLGIGADGLRGRGHFGVGAMVGTAFVWAGFVGVSAAEYLERWWQCGSYQAPAVLRPESPTAVRCADP
jgi:solute carrier family 35 protein F5